MACITAIAMSIPMGAFDLWGLKTAMGRDLETLADVLARNSTAALAFRDPAAARDVLQALRAEPSVTAACIYTQDGSPLAKYRRDGNEEAFSPPRPEEQGMRFEKKRLVQFRKIVFAGEALGTIYIESDLQRLDARLHEYTAAALATLLLTLVLATWTAALLQRPISRPLLGLVETAKAISSAADYSIRAELLNRDEFGLLVSAFN